MSEIYKVLPEKNKPLIKMVYGYIPKMVTVPFWQEANVICKSVVSVGDIVKEGQIIASPDNIQESAEIHSPVPGIVKEIIPCTLPNGKQCFAAEISVQGAFSFLGKPHQQFDWSLFTAASLRRSFAEKGIINTFKISNPVSLAKQLKDLLARTIDTKRKVIVRLFDEDPSCKTDSLLFKYKKKEIYEGAFIVAKAFEASAIVFVYDKENQQPEENFIEQDKLLDIPVEYTEIKKVSYYSGFQKKIIKNCNLCENIKKLGKISKNDLFIDTTTLVSLAEAIISGYPVAKSYVYVSGDCLKSSGFICFRVGTKYPDIVKQMGGFIKKPSTIVVNGFMTGYSPFYYDVAVTKYVKSIFFASKKKVKLPKQQDCIQCGRCRRICPEELCPDLIYRQVAGWVPKNDTIIKSVELCSDCSLCNAVCPSRLPLSQYIKMLEKNE